MTASLPYPDALERALGRIVAEARGQLDLIKERAAAVVAEAEARVAQAEARAAAIDARVDERLASLKDGADGRDGTDGKDGADGKDGEPGRDGTDGRDGVDGKDGIDGRDGINGENGKDGADGKDGVDGKDGRHGENGKDGRDGRDGQDVDDITVVQDGALIEIGFQVGDIRTTFELELPHGPAGKDGQDGKDGERGEIGPVGKIAAVTPWAPGVSYEADIRSHNGATWQATKDTANEPGGEDWVCIAARGANGDDGASFNPRRLWASDAEYRRLDVVALNGGAFVALQDNPGPCPGEGWMLIAQPGKRGERGDKGEKGERGLAGPAVRSLTSDDEGVITLTHADGSEVSCDLYPVLSSISR